MSMTSSARNVGHYQQVGSYTGVAEADPHQLVQMLLDGALGKIAAGKGHMTRGEVQGKGEAIGQAISIIGGLRASLDRSAGGEIAANLEDLYEYMERRLLEANAGNDVNLLDEVAALLREIKEAWQSIPQDQRANPGSSAAAV